MPQVPRQGRTVYLDVNGTEKLYDGQIILKCDHTKRKCIFEAYVRNKDSHHTAHLLIPLTEH